MELNDRIKSPTPKWFKRIIKVSLIIAGGAAAALGSEKVIDITLHPYTKLICKNLVFTGLVAAGIAKTAKETSTHDL